MAAAAPPRPRPGCALGRAAVGALADALGRRAAGPEHLVERQVHLVARPPWRPRCRAPTSPPASTSASSSRAVPHRPPTGPQASAPSSRAVLPYPPPPLSTRIGSSRPPPPTLVAAVPVPVPVHVQQRRRFGTIAARLLGDKLPPPTPPPPVHATAAPKSPRGVCGRGAPRSAAAAAVNPDRRAPRAPLPRRAVGDGCSGSRKHSATTVPLSCAPRLFATVPAQAPTSAAPTRRLRTRTRMCRGVPRLARHCCEARNSSTDSSKLSST